MPPALRMVVLGDSIMWGQGLAEPDKFSARVRSWLEGAVGRRMVKEFNPRARSPPAACRSRLDQRSSR